MPTLCEFLSRNPKPGRDHHRSQDPEHVPQEVCEALGFGICGVLPKAESSDFPGAERPRNRLKGEKPLSPEAL